MIPAICIGRGGSKGFPGKNSMMIGQLPLMAYPLLAAKNCRLIDEVFFSSEDEQLKETARHYGTTVIHRPEELATDSALSEDVFEHAYSEILYSYNTETPEFIVLLFANAPCITADMLAEMIVILREHPNHDSICTVSEYSMFHPARMRVIDHIDLKPFSVHIARQSTSDRKGSKPVYIYDCSAAVVRPRCLENIDEGIPPQKQLGKKVLPYKQKTPALDLDFEYQLSLIEFWLNKHWPKYEVKEKVWKDYK